MRLKCGAAADFMNGKTQQCIYSKRVKGQRQTVIIMSSTNPRVLWTHYTRRGGDNPEKLIVQGKVEGQTDLFGNRSVQYSKYALLREYHQFTFL